MLLEVAVDRLVTISQIFNVSPDSVYLSSSDFIDNGLVIREILVIDILVITEKERAKVQSLLLVFVVLRQDVHRHVHVLDYHFVRFETLEHLRIYLPNIRQSIS